MSVTCMIAIVSPDSSASATSWPSLSEAACSRVTAFVTGIAQIKPSLRRMLSTTVS
jgi:hypothetical protein